MTQGFTTCKVKIPSFKACVCVCVCFQVEPESYNRLTWLPRAIYFCSLGQLPVIIRQADRDCVYRARDELPKEEYWKTFVGLFKSGYISMK